MCFKNIGYSMNLSVPITYLRNDPKHSAFIEYKSYSSSMSSIYSHRNNNNINLTVHNSRI